MSEQRYVVYLSPERKDRFRYYHVLESGKIVRLAYNTKHYLAESGSQFHATIQPMASRIETFFARMALKKSGNFVAIPSMRY